MGLCVKDLLHGLILFVLQSYIVSGQAPKKSTTPPTLHGESSKEEEKEAERDKTKLQSVVREAKMRVTQILKAYKT